MAQRQVKVVECDTCGKKVEVAPPGSHDNLPRGWRHLEIAVDKHSHEIDVCSPGCGEKAIVSVMRGIYYEEPDGE